MRIQKRLFHCYPVGWVGCSGGDNEIFSASQDGAIAEYDRLMSLESYCWFLIMYYVRASYTCFLFVRVIVTCHSAVLLTGLTLFGS